MKVRQHLWFRRDMELAIDFYTSLIPDSSIDWVSTISPDNQNGPAGSVKMAGLTLANHPYMAFELGPLDPFDHGSAITVACETQAECEELYDRLKEGGSTEPGGFLQDRWGLRWQILPKRFGDDAKTVAELGHVAANELRAARFNIAKLEA